MYRSILKVILKVSVDHLREVFPPSGGPSLYEFQARANILVDALKDGSPLPIDGELLTEDGIKAGIEWIAASLVAAHGSDSWSVVCCHAVRIILLRDISQLLERALRPAKTLDSSKDTPAVAKHE